MTDNLVELNHIFIDYQLKKYDIRAITDLSLPIRRGKVTALVGESGSGKTTLASSILSCISEPGKVVGGEILFHSQTEETVAVHTLPHQQIRKFRWEKVSMVFQAAQSALNPVMTVYKQFEETIRAHGLNWDRNRIMDRIKELLDYVKLNSDQVIHAYPHELSGGMKQRIMIAFSMLLDPELIILDEPTTALDVITQDYIFRILKEINMRKGITMLLLTHDIGVVAKFADYVGVMYAGRLMEYGSVQDIFKHKYHPYTHGLIGATPSIISDPETMKPIEGAPPDLRSLPDGCVFSPRCPRRMDVCSQKEPDTFTVCDSKVKCYLYGGQEEGGK